MFFTTLACLNLKRQLNKSILVFILSIAIVCFLCSYAGNIVANYEQLASLPQTIPVPAYISNLNGSRNMGLLISFSTIEQLEESGLIEDMVITMQMSATYTSENSEKPNDSRIAYLMGFNTLAPYPSIQPDSLENIEEFFAGDSSRCIASRRFLTDNGLSVGDTVELDLYRYQYGDYPGQMTYEHLAPRTLSIADSFDSRTLTTAVSMTPDIIFPIDWAKKVFEECGSPFHVDAASFNVENPLEYRLGVLYLYKYI